MADAPPRRVAVYRTELLPPTETFVLDQARALRRWSPVLVGERRVAGLALDGVTVDALHPGRPHPAHRAVNHARRALGGGLWGMAALVARHRPGLIHAHFGFDGVEAWPVARRLGLKLLVTLHGADITTSMDWFAAGKGGRRWRSYPSRLRALARQDSVRFVAVSENIRTAALAAGIPAERLSVCPVGIDPARFPGGACPVAQRPPRVLFVGRLVEKKGCAHLLDAMARVRTACPRAELVVAGDGPQRAALERRAGTGVTFLGAVGRQQVGALLASARVLCAPSVTAANGDAEGLPVAVLEAQASGVPVVTSARGGATEGMVHGETGFAFAERDVGAMAAGLLQLLTDGALAGRMSAAARRYAATVHDIHARTHVLEQLYDALASSVPPHHERGGDRSI